MLPSLQLNDIQNDGFLALMNDNGDTREDLKLPDNDLGKEIKTRFDNDEPLLLTVLKAMKEETVTAIKAMNK